MNWLQKARIQRVISMLPARLATPLYYQLQRIFGGLRSGTIDPTSRMRFGILLCEHLARMGCSPVGKSFLEVGTGWRVNMPLAFWLCGAHRIVTIDLNRYLKLDLIRDDLAYLREHGESLHAEFQQRLPQFFDEDRWQQLRAASIDSVNDLAEQFGIEYLAPADATRTTLPDASIDFHVSCNVLEHIPPDVLAGILQESNRILRPDGLLLHRIDHTDHFSHADSSISSLNFLRYNDRAWDQIARNRYAYVNRLREDDYAHIFSQAGHIVHHIDSQPNSDALDSLAELPVDARFAGKSRDLLARLSSVLIASPRTAATTRAA